MKNWLMMVALSLFILKTALAQSYYVNAKGDKISIEIVHWGLDGIKVHEGHTKVHINAEDMQYCIIEGLHGRDSIVKLENTGMSFAPKSLLMKVLVVGKITYYYEAHWTGDEHLYTYVLLKNGAYQDITVDNTKWREFFSDNKDIYARVNNLKHPEYVDPKLITEIIKEYNAAE